MTHQDQTISVEGIRQEAADLGFTLTRAQAKGLCQYLLLLQKWNKAMNLVGRAGWPEIFRDLAADSLHLADFLGGLDLPERPLSLDLGAGAGLPGIPLRLLWEAGDYVLVELREKRAIFLRQAVAELKLPGVRVVHGRAEALGPELTRLKLPEKADLVVSRAFMPWPKLLPLAAGLLNPAGQDRAGGRLVILANESPPAELPGFELLCSRAYPSGAKARYFWGLTPAMA